MTAHEYRHELTEVQRRMSDRQLAATLPDGTGVSIVRYQPYWDVVLRSDGQYIITDSSRPGQKPLKVHGPLRSRSDAVQWARETAELWRSLHIHQPEWPWE
jgi:hypothetical protein